ncbi:hypothetical protein [Kitasatospora sp. NPDC001132]
MRRTTLALLTAGLLTATAACSSSTTDRPAAPTPTLTAAAQTGGATQPAQSSAADASAVLAKLTATVKTAKVGVTVTAETDPNHLLGRPGQYTSKTTFTDSRVKEADVQGEDAHSVARGGAVEVFASAADAERRANYIQGIVKSMPAAMEYDFVQGSVLVRVSKLLTPAQADSYKAAIGA